MASTQAFPSEAKVFNVKIDGVDVTSMIFQCDIFEDLFMPSWSCQLSLNDTQNLLMNIPIKSGSEVVIYIESDYPTKEKKTFKFIVYKISDRILLKQEHQGYILSCVTKEFFVNVKTRISRAFNNVKASQIVQTICNEYKLGRLRNVDSDSNSYSVIIPNMTSFAAINWVTRFAKQKNGGADFLFYQVDTGEYNYKSLDKMFVDRSGVKFKQINPNLLENGNQKDDAFINIEYYEFLSQHDSMNNFATGYYASKVLWHDMYTKEFGEHTFEYGDDIQKDKELKTFDGEIFENAYDSHIVFQPVSTNLAGDNVKTPSDDFMQWVSSRKSNLMKLEENRLVITVPGSVSHYKLIGKQVDVELPSHQDIDENEYLDKYMKGSYVVAAIRHTISGNTYRVTMELGKKRLEQAYG